jgi:uncharacterized SAM-binding protein YcdF (DUF218 family)
MNEAPLKVLRSRFQSRKWFLWLSGSMVFLALALLLFSQSLRCISNEPVPCNAIVLLGGATGERDPVAADLFQRGFSKWIVITGTGDCMDNLRLLARRGVPTNAIIVECAARSTKENAEFVAPLLSQRGFTNIILVTSWYHSRRALATFQRFAPGLQVRCVVSERKHALRYELRFIVAEYVKLVAYALRWHVSPLVHSWQVGPQTAC